MPSDYTVFRVHAIQRMLERKISANDIKVILRTGQIIENYPKDNPYPSYLKLGWVSHRPIHVVAADNAVENITIVLFTNLTQDNGTRLSRGERNEMLNLQTR